MRLSLIAAGLAVGLVACEDVDPEGGAETGMAVDTVVTERMVQDTAVVTTDTTVTVDTSINRGDDAVSQDTLKDTRDSRMGDQVAPRDTVAAPIDTRETPEPTP